MYPVLDARTLCEWVGLDRQLVVHARWSVSPPSLANKASIDWFDGAPT